MSCALRGARPQSERGAILVEFAIVLFLLLMLFFGIVEFGRAWYASQIVSEAGRVGARAFATTPLDDWTTDVFDPTQTVVDVDAAGDLDLFFRRLPILNRLLRPLMIFDTVSVGGVEKRVLRFPGLLVESPGGALTVTVPVVAGRDQSGRETVLYREPVVAAFDRDTGNTSVDVSYRLNFVSFLASRSRELRDETPVPAASGDDGLGRVFVGADLGYPPGQGYRPFGVTLRSQSVVRQEIQ